MINSLHGGFPEHIQVRITGSYHTPSRTDGYLGFLEVFIFESNRSKHGTIGCAIISINYDGRKVAVA
jgi:hypothetical protein